LYLYGDDASLKATGNGLMYFQLTDEQKMLKSSASAFIQLEIAPAALERDARGPRHLHLLLPMT
jgi:hypothetical protein